MRARSASARDAAGESGKLAAAASVAAVVAAALFVSLPAWLTGVPAGSDTVFHASWYTHFSQQFWAGELYPRWLAGMNGGLGSPVFFYYAPLPYHLTSLLGIVISAGDYGLNHLAYGTVLSFVASGLTCYLWLREFAGRPGAAAGAILYLLAPYHSVVDLFMRGAYSELWAFAWMPLVLLFARRVSAGGSRRAFAGLAVSYALLACTHLPATLIFSAVPVCYAYLASGRRAAATLRALAAMALGAGLSAAYLLPALTMQHAASFADMLGRNYFEHWVTFTKANPHDLQGQLLWSALTSAALVACSALLTRERRASAPGADAPARETSSTVGENIRVTERGAPHEDGRLSQFAGGAARVEGSPLGPWAGDRRGEMIFWVVAAALSLLLTTFASDPVWRLVPVLQKVQFPWRFQLVLCIAAAAAAALGLDSLRRRRRAAAYIRPLVFASLLAACWLYFWGGAARLTYPDLPRANRPDEAMLRWLDRSRDAPEYRPAPAVSNAEHDIETLLQNFCGDLRREPRACVSEGEGTATITRAAPRSLDLRVESATGLSFRLTRFHFPGWAARLDGRPHALTASRPDGLLLVSVPPGTHTLRLTLDATAPERLGLFVSVASALLLTLWSARTTAQGVVRS